MSCYVKFLLEEGRWGPISIDPKLRRRSLGDFPKHLAVSKAVFIVLICLSIKPFNLGNGGISDMVNVL